MTLRDWIAGQFLAATFGSYEASQLDQRPGKTQDEALMRAFRGFSRAAYAAADAMIEARKTPG